MIKGYLVIRTKRRRFMWSKMFRQRVIVEGFPPFDETKRKSLPVGDLQRYLRVYRKRRAPRLHGGVSTRTVRKWQELMV